MTGVSGSGKTTLILESLVPGLSALTKGNKLPDHVLSVDADGIEHIKLIDATPVGINVRSTVATYANVHDELRKVFARTPEARRLGYKAGDFSYNTGKLRCPSVTERASSALTCSSCPMWTFPARNAAGPDFAECRRNTVPEQSGQGIFSCRTDGHGHPCGTGGLARDLKVVRQRLDVLQKIGAGLPDAWGRNTQPFRWRSPASETGKRNGKNAIWVRVCLR